MSKNTEVFNEQEYPYHVIYFLAGDGYFFRLNRLCQWLIDTNLDCIVYQGPVDQERYGRDVTFRFCIESELIAFRLAHDCTII